MPAADHKCLLECLLDFPEGKLRGSSEGIMRCVRRLDEIIVFRQLSKGEVKEIADIMLKEVFARAEIKGIKIDVTERFKVRKPFCWSK